MCVAVRRVVLALVVSNITLVSRVARRPKYVPGHVVFCMTGGDSSLVVPVSHPLKLVSLLVSSSREEGARGWDPSP
jgi:hypothetical protein